MPKDRGFHFALQDDKGYTLREDAKTTIEKLKAVGIKPMLLTGDNRLLNSYSLQLKPYHFSLKISGNLTACGSILINA